MPEPTGLFCEETMARRTWARMVFEPAVQPVSPPLCVCPALQLSLKALTISVHVPYSYCFGSNVFKFLIITCLHPAISLSFLLAWVMFDFIIEPLENRAELFVV